MIRIKKFSGAGYNCSRMARSLTSQVLLICWDGILDVGINGQKVWENVNANISISDGRTIETLLDGQDVDYHFGKGQAIYGLVKGLSLG